MNGSQALAGIKVLDLSRVLAGPWCTQIFADFGADVVKIEAPYHGDDTRSWGPPFVTGQGKAIRGESAYFLSCNRNKRSAVINLANPEGAAVVRRLAAQADVLVENFKVGGLARYGLDFAPLAAINPRLVYCSITGFGQTGPYAARGGYDFVAQAMGGFMSITGDADGPPMRAGVATCDLSTGMYAAVSIMMALRHAEATGNGQHIDLSLLDTQIAMLANQSLNWLVGGINPERMGNRHPTIVPYTTFEAADRTIVIAVGNDSQFRALCAELNMAEWAIDPRFATSAARVANRDLIETRIQQVVITFDGATLIDRLVACGVPAGPVNSIVEVFADPFITARDTVHFFEQSDGSAIPTVAYPGKLSLTPARYDKRSPLLGEHTLAALTDWLGLDDAALNALAQSGAIVQHQT